MVCAACIYYAFRSQERVEGNERETQFVMMLDLADLTRLNVFRLGRCFKALVNKTSSGAAMVQGSYISADQGGARTFGPGGRGAGSSQRDKTIIDAKNLIHGYVWR
ncbi:hypothetical protein BN1723_018714, partial [Verticillium longisporum]